MRTVPRVCAALQSEIWLRSCLLGRAVVAVGGLTRGSLPARRAQAHGRHLHTARHVEACAGAAAEDVRAPACGPLPSPGCPPKALMPTHGKPVNALSKAWPSVLAAVGAPAEESRPRRTRRADRSVLSRPRPARSNGFHPVMDSPRGTRCTDQSIRLTLGSIASTPFGTRREGPAGQPVEEGVGGGARRPHAGIGESGSALRACRAARPREDPPWKGSGSMGLRIATARLSRLVRGRPASRAGAGVIWAVGRLTRLRAAASILRATLEESGGTRGTYTYRRVEGG
jgi:hypothetical protein